MSKVVYIGTAKTERSDGEDADRCVCCMGAHIYTKYIEWDDLTDNQKHHGLVSTALDTQNKETLHGRTVKVTFEFEDEL